MDRRLRALLLAGAAQRLAVDRDDFLGAPVSAATQSTKSVGSARRRGRRKYRRGDRARACHGETAGTDAKTRSSSRRTAQCRRSSRRRPEPQASITAAPRRVDRLPCQPGAGPAITEIVQKSNRFRDRPHVRPRWLHHSPPHSNERTTTEEHGTLLSRTSSPDCPAAIAVRSCKLPMATLEYFYDRAVRPSDCACVRLRGGAVYCVRLLSSGLEKPIQPRAAGSLFRPDMQRRHCKVQGLGSRTAALLHRFRLLKLNSCRDPSQAEAASLARESVRRGEQRRLPQRLDRSAVIYIASSRNAIRVACSAADRVRTSHDIEH